jgi:hypothetical protein
MCIQLMWDPPKKVIAKLRFILRTGCVWVRGGSNIIHIILSYGRIVGICNSKESLLFGGKLVLLEGKKES